MVSLWPWRGDSSSTASFEKTLSNLSTKIKDTQARLDRVRSSSRRSKVLSTLYLAFGYLVYAIVLLLVVGYKNVGAYEWTGLAGGPVIIFGVRRTLATYFTFRIEGLETRLKEYQEERSETIQKLKDATKYDSTMELIEKYGGVEGKAAKDMKKGGPGEAAPIPGVSGGKQTEGERKGNGPNRTAMPPPPTANIQHRPVSPNQQDQPGSMEPTAEFAPNAEHLPLQSPSPFQPYPQQPYPSFQQPESHWYDRIFDVLLGEDETAPKNRIVLLCAHCRLVNGQAPPGIKSLSELGRWRCMGCNGENGEVEDEGTRIVREVLDEQVSVPDAPATPVRRKGADQAPKRSLSAYMFFANAMRESIREENPGIQFGQVGKILGDRWRSLNEKQRESYEAMAAADMARYEDEKRAYNAMADIEEEKSSQDEGGTSSADISTSDGPAASVKKRRAGRK